MKQIIQELMEPRTFLDGHIRTPTPIMLKAGKAIMDLLTIAEQDRAGRLKAEQNVNVLSDEIYKLRTRDQKFDVSLEESIVAYRETVNEEYLKSFT